MKSVETLRLLKAWRGQKLSQQYLFLILEIHLFAVGRTVSFQIELSYYTISYPR